MTGLAKMRAVGVLGGMGHEATALLMSRVIAAVIKQVATSVF